MGKAQEGTDVWRGKGKSEVEVVLTYKADDSLVEGVEARIGLCVDVFK